MPKLIKNGQLVDDNAQVLILDETQAPEELSLPEGPVFVPFAVWQAHKGQLSGRPGLGVWLDSHEDVAELAEDLGEISGVALNFPKFTDGRSYSAAALLRTRYGFKGEIRAIGDVLRDQFFFMQRCGFDTIQPKAGKYSDAQLEAALASLQDFSTPYQAAVDQPAPLFRRAQRAA
ncbi:DUF934 domain-containing protein [Zoogloea sp.]|uniref:DUF934 domain-containing protein n=1 Tax=Zoogloea sp. TaxID=49181 RepID=UPI0026325057|nr:DUF934 domain-containing protein [Zoogloea sp.]MDD3352317.1 DUF934 domain-containing protein [Zoogloea sp.]